MAIKTQPGKPGFPFPHHAMDLDALVADHAAVVAGGCSYGLGSKVVPITSEPGTFHKVDCSGLVRWILRRRGIEWPDGSYVQHEQVRETGFKHSTVDALSLKDDVLRVAFMSPQDGGGVGHVALWLNGFSLESHGGVGPNRRPPGRSSWLKKAKVYVLTAPN